MRGSIAEQVADHIAALPERSFVAVRDIDGSRTAVDAAFSRLAADGDVLRIRKGLYWKGAPTALGVSPPRVDEVALALGGPGSGPAGVAAAQWLGLTSQAPSTYLTAVPARAPAPFPGISFAQRPVERLLHSLMPAEVAVLEVLRVGPAVVESDWENLPELIAGLAASGAVRLPILNQAIATEPHRKARSRWAEFRHTLPELSAITTTRARSQWPSGCTIGSAASDNQRRRRSGSRARPHGGVGCVRFPDSPTGPRSLPHPHARGRTRHRSTRRGLGGRLVSRLGVPPPEGSETSLPGPCAGPGIDTDWGSIRLLSASLQPTDEIAAGNRLADAPQPSPRGNEPRRAIASRRSQDLRLAQGPRSTREGPVGVP